ncbi:MAG: stage III sporulation protein AD [Lachnospiraceae bacterium]|nr:stage III sporulation protein AD [Lachnospiraceae bacterium]
MEIMKLAMMGIVGILFAAMFKSYKAEYGIYMGIAVCLIILGYGMQYFAGILSSMEQLRGYLNDNYSYIALLLKAVGATYACEFCAGVCKDAGYAGIAGQVEIIGKLYILLTGMPILLALLESIQALAG